MTTEIETADDVENSAEVVAPEPTTGGPTLRELAKLYGLSASYSPEDNKLRIRIAHRMPREHYDRFQFRPRGFFWGRFQQMLHSQSWSPRQHDFLAETCGLEIGDEETTLADRAEQKADRFVGYQVNRINDGNDAYARADAISGGIPLGQPIIVGHHSQARAERDSARIERALGKAVDMWERAEYWEWRAPRVIAHANWKAGSARLRARRIEVIEAEKRRQERAKKEAEKTLAAWTADGLTLEAARSLASGSYLTVAWDADRKNYWRAWDVLRPVEHRQKGCPDMTLQQVQEAAREAYGGSIEYAQRWINHCGLRSAYERAILTAQGAANLLEKKPRPKQPPLLNYRAPEGIDVLSRYHRGEVEHRPQVEMTSAEYQKIYHDYRGTYFVRVGSELHRVRSAILGNFMSRDSRYVVVFLTDSKEHKRPEKVEAKQEASK